MRSNGLLKWLMLPVIALLVFAGIRLFSGDHGPSTSPQEAGTRLSADERQALGIEGDTPNDTVATLVAQVRQFREELEAAAPGPESWLAEARQLLIDDPKTTFGERCGLAPEAFPPAERLASTQLEHLAAALQDVERQHTQRGQLVAV